MFNKIQEVRLKNKQKSIGINLYEEGAYIVSFEPHHSKDYDMKKVFLSDDFMCLIHHRTDRKYITFQIWDNNGVISKLTVEQKIMMHNGGILTIYQDSEIILTIDFIKKKNEAEYAFLFLGSLLQDYVHFSQKEHIIKA